MSDGPEEFEIRPAPDQIPGLLFARVPESNRPQSTVAARQPASVSRDDDAVLRDELNVALTGLGRAETRVHEYARREPGLPLRLAVVECLMWADTIREGLGIEGASRKSPLTVHSMPWNLFGGGRLNDPAELAARHQAVELVHGFRWARNRGLHERL